MAKRLTQISVEKAKPNLAKRIEIPDSQKPGLYLVIQPSGHKSWAVRYRAGGRPRKLTLKGFVSLALARKLAQQALDMVGEGKDPATRRKDLVADVAEEFVARRIKPRSRSSYVAQVNWLLKKRILPTWGTRSIHDLTKRDVLELLDSIADAGAPVISNRVLALLNTMFNWCIDRGILEVSPTRGVKRPTQEVARERVLNDAELRDMWSACDQLGYPYGPLIKLLALTGQRRGEVAGMRWDEIEGNVWTIPGARTKNKRPHSLPLSTEATKIIEVAPHIGDYVFTVDGSRPVAGFSQAVPKFKSLLRPGTNWVLHDLRRTAATRMADLGVQPHIIEAVLNHIGGFRAGVAGIYNRAAYAAEKREALERWAKYISSLANKAGH
jgi:integrase